MAEHELTAFGIILLASIFRGFFGMGQGMFAVPLLALALGDPKEAVVLVTFTAIIHLVVMLPWAMRRITWAEVSIPIFGMLFGLSAGLFAFKAIDTNVLEFLLGVALILISLWNLSGWHPGKKLEVGQSRPVAMLAGGMAGLTGALTAMAGPPLILYANLRGWSAQYIKAAVQPIFLVSCMFLAVGYAAVGEVTPLVWHVTLLSVLPVVLVTRVGMKYSDRLSARDFGRVFYVFILVMGLVMVAKRFFQS